VYGENAERIEKRHVRAATLDTPAAIQPWRFWLLRPKLDP
jgi:hypothetical protein